jgi:peroxiredoxin/DNA-binding HxlR family transcriptional regulator
VTQKQLSDAECGIAQTLGVVGDWWSWLIVRDVAGGITRFDGLQRELGISRRALAERLAALVDHGILHKQRYTERPPRFDYLLTERGEGLLPVLITMQEFGDRFVLGDGSVTATARARSREAERVHGLVGRTVPDVSLTAHDGCDVPVRGDGWRLLYFFPGAFAPDSNGYPPTWGQIPGAAGCTLESKTYAKRHRDFAALGCEVYGVSTQRPDQQAAFAEFARLPFRLLSDEDGRLAASLRLPMFRAAGVDRLKRQTLLLGPGGEVRHVQMPITDPAGSVREMLQVAKRLLTRS